ncbi:unnamed protein product [Parnassius apollo]|uniref:(apollo) hypothetical protein n=1 Tax=Parnassius apollo TaxID=110799 RepID=A0A8S3WVY2_PARAO|nr:unnamed protein product [Parnassius apollo]
MFLLNPVFEGGGRAEWWWSAENAVRMHARLRRALACCELGLLQLYAPDASVPALPAAGVRDAVEKHAVDQPVLVLSLGRFSMYSNAMVKHLWNEIRHDGPTFLSTNQSSGVESFPWKLLIADVSCYTLCVRGGGGVRSSLRGAGVEPRAVLALLTTTVTLSVLSKSLPMRAPQPPRHHHEKQHDEKIKYFTSGIDFRPSTLKEFVRGPTKHKRSSPEQTKAAPKAVTATGPLVSLGLHLHADTPPVDLRLDHDQVAVVARALHCISHIVALLRRPPFTAHAHAHASASAPLPSAQRSFIRSVSEIEEQQSPSEETPSENRSDLIPIFEANTSESMVKRFVWVQWVVSRASLAVATRRARLAAVADDLIFTVDLQPHYAQLKLKLAAATLRHYRRRGDNEDWEAGALGGRVLEAREPADAKQDNHFLAVTVTQAQISNLPASWREELHPKLLEEKGVGDSMWEVYATVAPLEAVLRPDVLRHAADLLRLLRACAHCPLRSQNAHAHVHALAMHTPSTWQLPFVYISAGGLRLLLTGEDEEDSVEDDTFMIIVGKVTVTPHPENPICRRAVRWGAEGAGGGAPAGRQYAAHVRALALRTARFHQLVRQEISESEIMKGTGGENPALKWSQPTISPVITPILHTVEVQCVVAPALALACGPALELDVPADCALELSLCQLALFARLADVYSHWRDSEQSLLEEEELCPYASLITTELEEQVPAPVIDIKCDAEGASREAGRSVADSGVDSSASHSAARLPEDPPLKKNVSIAPADHINPWEHVEVFVTMGVVEATLYVADEGAAELAPLRRTAPPDYADPTAADTAATPATRNTHATPGSAHHQHDQNVHVSTAESKDASKKAEVQEPATSSSASVTENARNVEMGKAHHDLTDVLPRARKTEGNLLLLQVTLHQPNLYYWRNETQKTLQVSLFDASVSLGAGTGVEAGCCSLLSTQRGARDPLTDIPPALATLKLSLPATVAGAAGGLAGGRGSMRLDVERPVLFDLSTDRVARLHLIQQLIIKELTPARSNIEAEEHIQVQHPILYRLRKLMARQTIESAVVECGQVGVRGAVRRGGVVRGAAARVRGRAPRAARCARAAARRACVLCGRERRTRRRRHTPSAAAARHAGCDAGGIDVDTVTLELRPEDLATLAILQAAVQQVFDIIGASTDATSSETTERAAPKSDATFSSTSGSSLEDAPDHYYKDDLRSGAFKLVRGGVLPLAYQVRAAAGALSWRYPHPRAISRLAAFPVPGLDEELDCVLELFEPTLQRWEPHTYFRLPTNEPREIKLDVAPPDVAFATMWRVRICDAHEPEPPPFMFKTDRFLGSYDPPAGEPERAASVGSTGGAGAGMNVTAEQVWGALRVDSYFAPRLLSAAQLALRVAALRLYLHLDPPPPPLTHSCSSVLEGYYVSRPLRRGHRALLLAARDAHVHVLAAPLADPPDARRCLLRARLSSDIIDCATGTMEPLVEEFYVQGAWSRGARREGRLRACASVLRVTLHVPRVRTLHALADDWLHAYQRNVLGAEVQESGEAGSSVLEGRVSLWVRNECACALRVSQHDTDELLPIAPGATLAYRWRSPYEVKKLRFALANPSVDWRWSSSIPFTEGTYRVRLEETSADTGCEAGAGAEVPLYVRVRERGAARTMHLSGRLVLANMLRHTLLYKVRARCETTRQWGTVCAGELPPEHIGPALLCDEQADLALKVKFVSNDTGWSGDIPLKECPKENVPWLVKVPSSGEVSYVSVWCRVVRARRDARLLAALWPLYVLRSHLPLDTDLVITTEGGAGGGEERSAARTVQPAVGRGACTHIAAPGTTAARHELTFQYRNIECSVTREAVPLHYGVTDVSVFERCAPMQDIEQVLQECRNWLKSSRRDAESEWPYSTVRHHWQGIWQPALLQPRCDVTVRYEAVRAGGGCSLAATLRPAALLASAAPAALTLRAHDAAPLARLEPGHAVAPPSALLTKPFFLSLEVGRETFVSEPLQVMSGEPGRYAAPPPGCLPLDRPAHIVIPCNRKVALLTMYYEIKEEINVLGITSTYVLFNKLDLDLLVSAIAVPEECEEEVVLKPKSFIVVPPDKQGSEVGVPLCQMSAWGRWRGGGPARAYVCVSLARGGAHVPVRLAAPPARRALALLDAHGTSVPVVVTQQQTDGRWLVVVARDPCPQYVLQNLTRATLAVAQPRNVHSDPVAPTEVTTIRDNQESFWLINIKKLTLNNSNRVQ